MTNAETDYASAYSKDAKGAKGAATRALFWAISTGVLSENDPARLRDAEASAADVPWLLAEVERLSAELVRLGSFGADEASAEAVDASLMRMVRNTGIPSLRP